MTGGSFDELVEHRLDLVLEGLPVEPDLVEAATVDKQFLGAGENVFEDADDDVVAPDRLRLGRTATVVVGVDADDLPRDGRDDRSRSVSGGLLLQWLRGHGE